MMNDRKPIKIYGIPNCDSVKKAVLWLKKNRVEFDFHDFKKDGLSKEKTAQWLDVQPLSKLLNKKSTAWRMLTAEERQRGETEGDAAELIRQYTNLIKRPVAEISGTILIGFNEAAYRKALNIL